MDEYYNATPHKCDKLASDLHHAVDKYREAKIAMRDATAMKREAEDAVFTEVARLVPTALMSFVRISAPVYVPRSK